MSEEDHKHQKTTTSLSNDDDDDKQMNEAKTKKPTKRGMKPRSKRNRKRPRSEVRSNAPAVFQADVVPLENNHGHNPSGSSTPSKWIRVIQPYPYTFSSFCKARWVGRTVFDVYSQEFGSYPPEYYKLAIQQGRILVSDQKVTPDYHIQAKDILSHTVHRHEPAVAVSTNQPPYVTVLQETDTLLAIDKPGTLPIHPCGT